MNFVTHLNRKTVGGIAALMVVSWMSLVHAADTKDCSATKKSKHFITNIPLSPGDAPNHEITQFVRVDAVSSTNPDFDGAEQLVYGQGDQVAGTGSHHGYSVSVQKSGDRVFYKWEGTHKTTVKDGGAWEVSYEGRFQLTGGTGKFSAIRGAGTYRGSVDAQRGAVEKVDCQATY
jgi:hypothetical protein